MELILDFFHSTTSSFSWKNMFIFKSFHIAFYKTFWNCHLFCLFEWKIMYIFKISRTFPLRKSLVYPLPECFRFTWKVSILFLILSYLIKNSLRSFPYVSFADSIAAVRDPSQRNLNKTNYSCFIHFWLINSVTKTNVGTSFTIWKADI